MRATIHTKVICIDDYQSSISKNILDNSSSKIAIPKANVLIFTTEDGSKIALRPSGTEPKIKFYISVNTTLSSTNNYEQVNNILEQKIDKILASMQLI